MKHMKKSMFITTLAMVVVLVVALSTATFAWYTANTTVQATTTAAQSASSDSAAIAIETSEITANSTGTSVTMTLTDAIAPMILTTDISLPANSEVAPAFTTAPVNNTNQFTTAGTSGTPATIGTVQDNNDVAANTTLHGFYVGNTNKDTDPEVKVTVTINSAGYIVSTPSADYFNAHKTDFYTTADHITFTACTNESEFNGGTTYYQSNANIAKYLRVAVYSAGKYIGTWALTNTAVSYGTITSGTTGTVADNANINSFTAIDSGTASTNRIALTGVDSELITLYAWFDGCLLTATESNAYCSFNITFDKYTA